MCRVTALPMQMLHIIFNVLAICYIDPTWIEEKRKRLSHESKTMRKCENTSFLHFDTAFLQRKMGFPQRKMGFLQRKEGYSKCDDSMFKKDQSKYQMQSLLMVNARNSPPIRSKTINLLGSSTRE